jgi:hypothetical protein
MKVKKHNFSNIIHMITLHLNLYEDGTIINDRYSNYQATLSEVVDRLSQ